MSLGARARIANDMVVPGGERGSVMSSAIGTRSSRLDPANTSRRVGETHSGAPRGEVSATRSTDPGTPSQTTNACSARFFSIAAPFVSSSVAFASSPASGAGQTQSGVAADAVAAPRSASGGASGAPIERGAESTTALGGRESTFCGGEKNVGGSRRVLPEALASRSVSPPRASSPSRAAAAAAAARTETPPPGASDEASDVVRERGGVPVARAAAAAAIPGNPCENEPDNEPENEPDNDPGPGDVIRVGDSYPEDPEAFSLSRLSLARGGSGPPRAGPAREEAKEGKCVSLRAPRNISNCVCLCASCVRFRNRLCAEMERFERLDAAAYAPPWPGPALVGAVELPSSRWKMEVWIARDAVYTALCRSPLARKISHIAASAPGCTARRTSSTPKLSRLHAASPLFVFSSAPSAPSADAQFVEREPGDSFFGKSSERLSDSGSAVGARVAVSGVFVFVFVSSAEISVFSGVGRLHCVVRVLWSM